MLKLPDSVPEPLEFVIVLRIKGNFALWIDQDAILESPSAKHHGSSNAGILKQYSLWNDPQL